MIVKFFYSFYLPCTIRLPIQYSKQFDECFLHIPDMKSIQIIMEHAVYWKMVLSKIVKIHESDPNKPCKFCLILLNFLCLVAKVEKSE